MYDLYSTNFAYQAPSYPNSYAYSNPEMISSCRYHFQDYGYPARHNVSGFQPCDRVPNVARVERTRIVANNTPSKPDNNTRTLHHFPPSPPQNVHVIRGFNDEQPKKLCNADKSFEDLSDEGNVLFEARCKIMAFRWRILVRMT